MKKLVYAAQMIKAADYIEKRLSLAPDFSAAAREAHMSPDNFWRMFKKLFGETASEYIRRRRLTAAAHRLLSSKKSVLKICLELGYDSQEAFTRAFKKNFGVTPAVYRKNNHKVYNLERARMTPGYIRNILSGCVSLEPRIKKAGGGMLYGMGGQIGKQNSVYDAVIFFARFMMKAGQKGCSSSEESYVIVTPRRGASIFSTDKELKIFAGSPEV